MLARLGNCQVDAALGIMMYPDLNRRELLRSVTVAGGSLVIAGLLPG